ncbi:MAG: arginine--tRNA ligase [Nanoarchaeota archaeon]|nr:arginine--tRNA ligase [Nanoarchaeota archaeon]
MKELKDFIKKVLGEEVWLETPPNPSMGDYSTIIAFHISKKKGRTPKETAERLVKKLNKKKPRMIKEIKRFGPYINFFIDRDALVRKTVRQALKKGYGSMNIGKGKKALVEHASINPNASPHVGRSRNAMIGDVIVRVLKFLNYKVNAHYLVNDAGKQIAMLVLGARNRKKIDFDSLLDIYVEINKKLELDPEIEKKVFELLNKFEKGHGPTVKEFNRVVGTCIRGQKKIFNDFGIGYDYYDYESQYLWNRKVDVVLKKLEKTGRVFVDENGRKVLDLKGFDLPMRTPVFVLTREDGTSLYGLRDLAYNLDKAKTKKNVVVLGEDHKLYFQQIKASLGLIGVEAPEIVHYSFILLKEGKMSTRRGKVVLLEDFMKEAVTRIKKIMVGRKISKKDFDKIAKQVAYAAIKYSLLKVSPDKNVVFDWEQALNMEGDSGPYLQYSVVRAKKILSKSRKKRSLNFKAVDDNSFNLCKKMSEFPGVVKKFSENYKPNLIANYVLELAKLFNEFYAQTRVIGSEQEGQRLALVKAVSNVLATGMGLLGLEVPKEM